MNNLGTLEWAQNTRGFMNRKEQLTYLFDLVKARFFYILKKSTATTDKHTRVNPDLILVPDSALSKLAEEQCRELSCEDLYGHCMRAYYWGALLAQYDNYNLDAEELFIAAMLHDLGLTEKHGSNPNIGCFAVAGTFAADTFLKEVGTPEPMRVSITQAICLHLNERVPKEPYGGEAHYLHAGTVLDVMGGPRYKHLPKSAIATVVGKHPRGNMKQMMQNHVRKQMKERPSSRMALLGKVGFAKMIAESPFSS